MAGGAFCLYFVLSGPPPLSFCVRRQHETTTTTGYRGGGNLPTDCRRRSLDSGQVRVSAQSSRLPDHLTCGVLDAGSSPCLSSGVRLRINMDSDPDIFYRVARHEFDFLVAEFGFSASPFKRSAVPYPATSIEFEAPRVRISPYGTEAK